MLSNDHIVSDTNKEHSKIANSAKILNNILYLNEKLFNKIVASPLCSLCKLHNETIIRSFSTCRVTHTSWEQLRPWISGTGILLPESMDPQTVISGAWNAKTPDFVIINYIILEIASLEMPLEQPPRETP